MNDKEFEELKRKVAEEEQRRRKIQRKKDEIEKLRNGLGIVCPNGWTCYLTTIVTQKWTQLTGNDGNGRPEERNKQVELDEKTVELLFEAFEIMAAKREKEMEKLK